MPPSGYLFPYVCKYARLAKILSVPRIAGSYSDPVCVQREIKAVDGAINPYGRKKRENRTVSYNYKPITHDWFSNAKYAIHILILNAVSFIVTLSFTTHSNDYRIRNSN